MATDVTANADPRSATPAEPAWRARWLIIARRAWPVVTVLAITANLLVLPAYIRSLLTRTSRAELPAAHLTPAEYVAIQICYVAVFMLVCLAVATVIYVRAGREPVALFCAYTLMALGCGFGFIAGLTITNPILNALSVIFTGVTQVMLGWLFLIFPSGRFVPRWSRWCALAATAAIAAVTIYAVARIQPAPSAAQTIGVGLFLLGAGAQVYRYRRVSSVTERQQTKWVVFGLAAAMAAIIVFQLGGLLVQRVVPSTMKSQVGNSLIGGVWILMLGIIPVFIGIAVLRTHLWDIGLVISRTLTYAIVTALLVGVYAGLVLLTTRVLPIHTAVAVALSTLAAAAAFHLPLVLPAGCQGLQGQGEGGGGDGGQAPAPRVCTRTGIGARSLVSSAWYMASARVSWSRRAVFPVGDSGQATTGHQAAAGPKVTLPEWQQSPLLAWRLTPRSSTPHFRNLHN
jgi:hypothetical protein